MTGEQLHLRGADGARRAKQWLEATTRVSVPWVNPEPFAVEKLSFDWVSGNRYSFDLGGLLLGEEFQGQEFLAECKNYQQASDQGTLYTEYLAKCYRAYVQKPDRCNNFLWITWAPFSVSKWNRLCSSDEVAAAVLVHRGKVLQEDEQVDVGTCDEVASRLWLIVLSDRQEKLVVTADHRAMIVAQQAREGIR